jgi:hypothetical protein
MTSSLLTFSDSNIPTPGITLFLTHPQVVNNRNRTQQDVAVDDANVGGRSRVDVSRTRLYVALRCMGWGTGRMGEVAIGEVMH